MRLYAFFFFSSSLSVFTNLNSACQISIQSPIFIGKNKRALQEQGQPLLFLGDYVYIILPNYQMTALTGRFLFALSISKNSVFLIKNEQKQLL